MADKLYYLTQFFWGVPKLETSKLFIKGKLEKLDKLSKSNSLRHMINASKKPLNFVSFLPHGLGL